MCVTPTEAASQRMMGGGLVRGDSVLYDKNVFLFSSLIKSSRTAFTLCYKKLCMIDTSNFLCRCYVYFTYFKQIKLLDKASMN